MQGAVRGFKFEAQNPIEVKLLCGEKSFELVAAGRVEFDEHFSFVHVRKDATRLDLRSAVQAFREFLGSLTRQASECVLREVTRHSDSRSARMAAAIARYPNTTPAEKKQMAEMRTAHPYYTYDAIQAQPALIEKILARRAAIERAADALAEKERITFVGIGTSFHAAQIAESWMRVFTAGRFLAQFEQSFELVHHPIAFGPKDAVIVITHTGTTAASIEAMRVARASGALTVAITGEMSGEGIRGADFHIETCEQEVSFAYTKSYTTALAALALLIGRVAERQKLLSKETFPASLERVPALMKQALTLEPQVRELAKQVARLSGINIFGSGAAWATAREGALKIKESCYIAAEGFETEEILHGPFSEIDSRSAMIGLLTGTPADDRARAILRAAGELKMLRAAVAVPSANREISAAHILIVPEAEEYLAAFVHLVPLQLLTYFTALERSLNPDTGRQDQPAHAAASRHYKY